MYMNVFLLEVKSRNIPDYYPLANEVGKGYSNATVRPSVRPPVTSLWTL